MHYLLCTRIPFDATHSSLLTPEITHKMVGYGRTFQSSRTRYFIEVSKLQYKDCPLFQNP